MLFNNIDKSTKIEILEENIPKYEKNVYEILIQLGIEPGSFNEETFEEADPSVQEDDLTALDLRKRLKVSIDALTFIKQEIANLEE
jgi:hypothetical protein